MSGIRKDAFIHILRGNTKRLRCNHILQKIIYLEIKKTVR